jgi:hypothetical protein
MIVCRVVVEMGRGQRYPWWSVILTAPDEHRLVPFYRRTFPGFQCADRNCSGARHLAQPKKGMGHQLVMSNVKSWGPTVL